MNAALNRFYRMLFCRGGHRVHSPFVFDLITTVIEEQSCYYCYESLEMVRQQLLQSNQKVTVRNRTTSIKKTIDAFCFTEPEDRLLFRLANRFNPKAIFVDGSHFGLTPLYLTAHSRDATCIVIESNPSIAAIACEFLKKNATTSIDLRNDWGDIPERLDFIVWGRTFIDYKHISESYTLPHKNKRIGEQSVFLPNNDSLSLINFERFLPYIDDHSVMVISGINASSKSQNTWKAICVHPSVTVTIDLYRIGIVFFNPKHHQETYLSVVK